MRFWTNQNPSKKSDQGLRFGFLWGWDLVFEIHPPKHLESGKSVYKVNRYSKPISEFRMPILYVVWVVKLSWSVLGLRGRIRVISQQFPIRVTGREERVYVEMKSRDKGKIIN